MAEPRFLIASPTLMSDVFNGTVVLVLRHDETGAHGLVINRPLQLTVDEVMQNLGLDARQGEECQVLWGGPVEESTGFVLVRSPWPESEDIVEIGGGVGVGMSKELLEHLVEGGKSPFQLCLGYAGWAPEQLEAEMAEGAWIETDLDASIIFDEPMERRWITAIQSLGIDNPVFLQTRPVDE